MPLRVLMIGWELPPFNSGGLGEACLGLARSLSEKGVQITFVLPRSLDLKFPFMKIVFADVDEDVSFLPSVYLSSKSDILIKNITCDDFPPDYISASLKFAEKMYKVLKKEDVDIIHAHDWLCFPAGIVAKNYLKKPLIAHVHSTEFDRSGNLAPNPFVYEIEKQGFENAESVVAVAQRVKNIIVEKYNIPGEKIKVVHNGIDPPKNENLPPTLTFFKRMGYKVVLFLGRITLQKGPEYFVRAAEKVLRYNPKVIFVVTGSGDMYEYMMGEAARLKVLDKFIFTGFLRGEEKNRVYKAADLYVMPSVSEPFGITALEAIANNTPVLISKQSGVAEVLNHALKVDFWDIDETANKILSVLAYEPLPITLIKESTKEIRNLSWENSAQKMLEIYHQLLS